VTGGDYERQPPGKSALRRARFSGKGLTYLLTSSCAGRQALLTADARQVVVEALLWLQARERIALHAFVVMSTHVHVIVTLVGEAPLPAVMHSLKSFTANRLNELLGRTGAFWEDGYRDDVVRSQRGMTSAITYVENNPVRAAMAARPEEYEWSSAWLGYRARMDSW
jgi:putative transposase